MDSELLQHYEAIEQASIDMLEAARNGDWDQVVKLEGACMVLISRLKHAAHTARMDADSTRAKSRIMQRILVNDAEIRHLAEPWLADIEQLMEGKLKTIH
jgi:flagellar protein FliT